MKKLFSLIILLICPRLVTNAQFIGLRAGFGLASIPSSLNSSYYPGEIKSRPILGFQGGVIAEFPLIPTVKWLTIETGLMIQTKGSDLTYQTYKSPLSQPDNTYLAVVNTSFTGKIYLHYLDIPLSVKMYFSVGKASVYYEMGPYLGIGLSGKQHSWNIRTITWGPRSDNDYKENDSGISMGLGMKIKPFEMGLSYDLGFANIDPTGSRIAHTRFFSLFMEFMIIHKGKSQEQPDSSNE